jgi:uracil-DNA glycosylase
MTKRPLNLSPPWAEVLGPVLRSPELQALAAHLRQRKAAGIPVYPPGKQIFAALDAAPPEQVRVVIVGQDPYHGPGQAQGFAFSVAPGVPVPPSLQNIYKELQADLGLPASAFQNGDLRGWARQGVLLLNAVLTVEGGAPGAHQKLGWETVTDAVIAHLSEHFDHRVFILWGSYAQRKGAQIDRARHAVLSAPHPSPLSAHRGFFGSKPFSQANTYLAAHGFAPIAWEQHGG